RVAGHQPSDGTLPHMKIPSVGAASSRDRRWGEETTASGEIPNPTPLSASHVPRYAAGSSRAEVGSVQCTRRMLQPRGQQRIRHLANRLFQNENAPWYSCPSSTSQGRGHHEGKIRRRDGGRGGQSTGAGAWFGLGSDADQGSTALHQQDEQG